MDDHAIQAPPRNMLRDMLRLCAINANDNKVIVTVDVLKEVDSVLGILDELKGIAMTLYMESKEEYPVCYTSDHRVMVRIAELCKAA